MNKNHKLHKSFKNLNEEDQEKYIKEMHEMADKAAKKNNIIFIAVVIPALIIFILVVKQMFSFSSDVANDSNSNKQNNTETTQNSTNKQEKKGEILISKKISEYIENKDNRQKSFKEAISINKGDEKGVSIIFISQIYRDNGYDIPKNTISTKGLLQELEKKGWTKESDYKKLQKGDICFTPEDTAGSPSHAYIFMGWVKEGKTDYAYVCDGQTSDYNDTLHKRNLSVSTPKKDKISFFMKQSDKK